MVRRWLAPRYALKRILIANVYPNYTAIHALWQAPKPSPDVYTQLSPGYLRWGLHWFTFTLVKRALHEFEPPGGVLDHSEAPPSRCLFIVTRYHGPTEIACIGPSSIDRTCGHPTTLPFLLCSRSLAQEEFC